MLQIISHRLQTNTDSTHEYEGHARCHFRHNVNAVACHDTVRIESHRKPANNQVTSLPPSLVVRPYSYPGTRSSCTSPFASSGEVEAPSDHHGLCEPQGYCNANSGDPFQQTNGTMMECTQ